MVFGSIQNSESLAAVAALLLPTALLEVQHFLQVKCTFDLSNVCIANGVLTARNPAKI